MKRVMHFVGALSLAFVMSSCAVRQARLEVGPPENISAGNAAYVASGDGSFAVRVPAGWKLVAQNGGSMQLADEVDAQHGVMVVRSFPTTVVPDDAALKQVREGVLEGLEQQTEKLEILAQDELEVAGRRAFQLRYRCQLKARPVQGALTVAVGEAGLLSVNTVAPERTFEKARGAMTAVLTSIRLEAPPPTRTAYVDPEGSFRMQVPAGWAFQTYTPETTHGQAVHSFAAMDGSDSALVVARLVNDTVRPGVSRRIIELIENGTLSRLSARIERIAEVRPVTLGGRPAVGRVLHVLAGEQRLYLYEVIQVSENEVTAIVAYGPRARLDQQRPALEATAGSFVFAANASTAVAAR